MYVFHDGAGGSASMIFMRLLLKFRFGTLCQELRTPSLNPMSANDCDARHR